MNRKITTLLATLAFSPGVSTSAQAAIVLFDYGFNIDGVVSVPTLGDPVPAAVNISAFDDFDTGLGSISVTVTGVGMHSVDAFFDHEISGASNPFDNETGSSNGTAAAGQSWEIDEPGFGSLSDGTNGSQYFGDIFSNFQIGALDNQVLYDDIDGQSLVLPDDISMAMGWDFTLALGEEALITLALDTAAPSSGFYLKQSDDPEGSESIFFSSTLKITGPSVPPVPVPAAIWLFASGIIGLVGFSRRRSKS